MAFLIATGLWKKRKPEAPIVCLIPSVMRPSAGGIFNQPFRVFTFVSETNEEIHHADKAASRP